MPPLKQVLLIVFVSYLATEAIAWAVWKFITPKLPEWSFSLNVTLCYALCLILLYRVLK